MFLKISSTALAIGDIQIKSVLLLHFILDWLTVGKQVSAITNVDFGEECFSIADGSVTLDMEICMEHSPKIKTELLHVKLHHFSTYPNKFKS